MRDFELYLPYQRSGHMADDKYKKEPELMMKGMDDRSIGTRLKQIRERLGLSMDKMSQATGVAASYISDFEKGKKLPPSKYIRALVIRYNVSSDYIYTGKGAVYLSNDPLVKILEFDYLTEAVIEMLKHMKMDNAYLFSMLAKFAEYKKANPIDKEPG